MTDREHAKDLTTEFGLMVFVVFAAILFGVTEAVDGAHYPVAEVVVISICLLLLPFAQLRLEHKEQ